MLLPDITALILELRLDLRERFGFDQPENAEAFEGWLTTNGLKEYRVLAECPEFHAHLQQRSLASKLTRLQERVLRARRDVRSAFPLPEKLIDFLHWFYTHGVLEHGLWPFLSEEERNLALKLPGPCSERLHELAATEEAQSIPVICFANRPLGVNLIGYAFGQLGIGEDARMAARALLAAGVPVTMLNFLPGADIPQNDRSMAEHVSADGPYAFNLFV